MMAVRPTALAAAVTAGLVAWLVAGAASPAGARPTAKRPAPVAKIRLAGGEWGYPSPFAYIRGPGLIHTNFVFDTLVWKDGSGRDIPWLARAWQRSRDGLSWRFTLRRGVQWHDGRPLTAADVVFTFDYMRNGPGRTAPGLITPPLDFITEVVAPSRWTVVFRLNKRFAPFVETVAGRVPIIPRHIWSDVREPARLRGPRALVGSGPYRLVHYDEASHSYRYVANRKFFLGVPVVRTLEFVPVSDEFLALRRGQVDAAGTLVGEQGYARGALRPFFTPRYGRLSEPGEWTRGLYFNLARGFPYSDRRFRQAVAHAVNRFGLVRRILSGRGRPGSTGVLAPSSGWAAPGLPTYPYNLARARRLLDEIGLRDQNGDGTRDLPGGRPFTPELQTSTRFSPLTPELIREYLRAVGIELRIRALDSAAADAAAAQGRYELSLIGHGALGGDPDLLRTMLSATVQSRSFIRVHGYRNARFEELAAAQLATVNARQRRKQVYEMQRIVASDVPMISLYVPTRLHFYVKRVFNAWYFTPGGVFGAYPGVLNKHAFVTGRKVGFAGTGR